MLFRSGNHKFHLLSDISASTIKKSTDNSIWFHSKKSIIRISPQKDSIIEYPIDLKNSYINTFEVDLNNNVWISSDRTLLKLNTHNNQISILKEFPLSENSDNYEIIKSIKNIHNNIWCGTNHGKIFKYDILTDEYVNINYKSNKKRNIIYCFFNDENDIFFSVDKLGIYKYNPLTNKADLVENDFFSLVDNCSVTYLYKDIQNNYWLSLNETGIAYTSSYSCLKILNSESKSAYNFKSNKISSLFYDENDDLWIGTDGGGL